MILTGKLYRENKIIKESKIDRRGQEKSFRDELEDTLINLCRELDIPVPLWLDKNTSEFVRYRKTFFTKDQFVEKVKFDRFEIRAEI
ncbi:hypothetical protein RBH29_01695 [Herbivorax sp. ANBcel31]|uniref:hypothetical protein n=1 Tax=Herbivorax sp. ANBcel31 TaxID=3069754 RepID=UPI0027AE6096|nr:hypothetical protein [Herbivorax sp. ANBcel31]MDQ2085148.1 hypothetical protein [Herbivorax sp. ANBcel31]